MTRYSAADGLSVSDPPHSSTEARTLFRGPWMKVPVRQNTRPSYSMWGWDRVRGRVVGASNRCVSALPATSERNSVSSCRSPSSISPSRSMSLPFWRVPSLAIPGAGARRRQATGQEPRSRRHTARCRLELRPTLTALRPRGEGAFIAGSPLGGKFCRIGHGAQAEVRLTGPHNRPRNGNPALRIVLEARG